MVVVNQPPKLAIFPASTLERRSQVSWTASYASLNEPSIRQATARRWGRLTSNCSSENFFASIRHISSTRFVMGMTNETSRM